MHADRHPDELYSFAGILTQHLPGAWTQELRQHAGDDNQQELTADVWDMNHIAETLAQHPPTHDVVLTRNDGLRLFLIDHPRYDDELLIAAMAPTDTPAEAFRGVREPDGIAISADPEQAAENILTTLLPRYETALAQVQDNAARLSGPSVRPDTLVMTWTESGDLAVTTERADVAGILTTHGFVHDGQQTYTASGDDTAHQAQCVRAAGSALGALNIGVTLRHGTLRGTPTTLPIPVPRTAAPNTVRSR
ncbi:hypothetical protein [Streptomyces antarcticus]|uniref:hypothetical protein n=1 Tax=Streptomyces antarcticus TaxID=2996458 RepID=UPI00226E49DF|nr:MULTISPECIES: hypothetical protein [unclassified Streptomyces]MCY0942338.1 hypothetical protein [Streptomyces sp. H34-AA3]MCZ4080665.1 hypothetical protein [Streptomyces sp. H34-S5]